MKTADYDKYLAALTEEHMAGDDDAVLCDQCGSEDCEPLLDSLPPGCDYPSGAYCNEECLAKDIESTLEHLADLCSRGQVYSRAGDKMTAAMVRAAMFALLEKLEKDPMQGQEDIAEELYALATKKKGEGQ